VAQALADDAERIALMVRRLSQLLPDVVSLLVRSIAQLTCRRAWEAQRK
jgi:hypothetical protein